MRALLLLVCCLPVPLAAQLPADDCVDRSGRPVRGVVRNDMPWAGAATELNGESVIYWNQGRNGRATLPARLFIYMHECGHHVLGHVWKGPAPEWEAEADCWAVQTLLEQGRLRRRHLGQLEGQLRRSRAGVTRFSGAPRRSLGDCIDVKTDRVEWARALDALAAASADSFTSIMGQAVPRPSSRTGIHESEIDVPGTYDCEVTASRDVRCTVFTARSARSVLRRHRALDGIVRRWLPAAWRAEDRPAGAGLLRRLEVSDTIGARLTLSATEDLQVVFVMHPAPRSPDAILPPEKIPFRLTWIERGDGAGSGATVY